MLVPLPAILPMPAYLLLVLVVAPEGRAIRPRAELGASLRHRLRAKPRTVYGVYGGIRRYEHDPRGRRNELSTVHAPYPGVYLYTAGVPRPPP